MSMFEMYILVKLNNIIEVMFGLGAFICLLSGVLFVAYGILGSDEYKQTENIIKTRKKQFRFGLFFAILGTLFCIASNMIPTTKEACAIIVVPKVIEAAKNSEELKKMPETILKTANEWIKEATPSNIKEGVQDVIKEIKK